MQTLEGGALRLSRRHMLRGLALTSAALVLPGHRAVAAPGPRQDPETTWRAFVTGLPKAELHMHVEGVVDPWLAFELAERNGLRLAHASPEGFARTLTFDSLESFLRGYGQMLDVLRTGEDFHDATLTYLERARAENVLYAELHFDPQAHVNRGIAFEEVVDGIRSACASAERDLGIGSRLIMALQRDLDVESARAVYASALARRDDIVGLGLDNYEEPGFPAKFEALFREAAAEGFRLTSHCDLEVPDSVEHVRGCIELLGVDRLDHGYSVVESEALTALCRARGIGLTACPTTDWNHPDPLEDYYVAAVTRSVGRMLELGLRVSLNTDDPGLMGGRYLTDVMVDTRRALDLGIDELVTLSRNAFESTWAPEEERRGWLAALDAYVDDRAPAVPG